MSSRSCSVARKLLLLLCLVWVAGCQSARDVVQIGEDITDPTGVSGAVSVGDPSLKVRLAMGEPEKTLSTKSHRTESLVYHRYNAEGVVVVDTQTKRVVRVLNVSPGWMTPERLEQFERESGSS